MEPQYCISLELDITNFLKMVKKHNYSFTFAFVYAVCKCANEIEELWYRFLEDEVVLYDTIHTSSAYLDAETELFKFVSVPMKENMEADIKAAMEKAKNQKEYFEAPPANEYYPAWEPPVSCLRAIRKFLSSEPPKTQDIVILPLLVLDLTETVFNFFESVKLFL